MYESHQPGHFGGHDVAAHGFVVGPARATCVDAGSHTARKADFVGVDIHGAAVVPVAAAVVEVAMEVDEAGGDQLPCDVHDLGRQCWVDALGDLRYLHVFEGNVPAVIDVLSRVHQCPPFSNRSYAPC